MKSLTLAVALVMALASCASYKVTRTETELGEVTTEVSINSLWHDVEKIQAIYGTFSIKIGSMGSAYVPDDVDLEALACVLYPSTCER